MFLLPLQPLPGAPSVVSPESSGLIDIGTGFRDMLQNAQQHLGAEGAPDVPMPERPVLAALMADLLAGGSSPPESENSPKQIVSVLVPETPLPEGDVAVPLDSDLSEQGVVPNSFGRMLSEEDLDTYPQVGKPVVDTQDVAEDVVLEKRPVIAPSADGQIELPESGERSTVGPVLSDKSLKPEPTVLPRTDVPTPQLGSLPLSSSEQADAPLPVFGQPETPLIQVKPMLEGGNTGRGQEGVLEDAKPKLPTVIPLSEDENDVSIDGDVQVPQQTDQAAQISVSGFVADQVTPQTPPVDGTNREQELPEAHGQQNSNGQQNSKDQNQVASVPFTETRSDAPVEGSVRSNQPVTDGESETSRTAQTPLQQTQRDATPLQTGDVQVSEDQPSVVTKPVVTKPAFGTPEQTSENNRVLSSAGVAAPSVQIKTDVESPNVVPTSPLKGSADGGQRVAPLVSQDPETPPSVLPQAPQSDSSSLAQSTIRREGVADAQAPIPQPVLRQDVPLGTMSEGEKNVGSQQPSPVLQTHPSLQGDAPVTRPVSLDRESVQPVVARQNMPVISSPETQTGLSGQSNQTRPEMATLLSGEHNEVTQLPLTVTSRPVSVDGRVMSQTQVVSQEADILPQPPLGITNGQNVQIGQGFKPSESVLQPAVQAPVSPENMSQPAVQAPVSPENMSQPAVQAPVSPENASQSLVQENALAGVHGGDQVVLPRRGVEGVSTAVPQTPRSPEASLLNRPEMAQNVGAQTLDQSQIASSSDAQPLNRSEFAVPLASVAVSEASPEAQEAQQSRSAGPQLAQQAQPVQREVAPSRIDVQAPVAQPQQAVVQDAAVTQHVQAAATERDVQRSVERPIDTGTAPSETTEARVFVAPDSQLNDDAGREQRAPSQQTFAAPQAVSEQSVPFEEAVEQEVLLPNVDQRVDVETQSIDRIPGRPDMRVDMMNGTPRAASTLDVPQGQLNGMPSEEIDQQYRVGEQVIRNARVMTREGATQVTMRLDPQELGEVTIRLSSQDQIVSGEITVESQKVQEIVQRNLGALREALAGQGIQLENIDVSVHDRSAQPDRETFRENLEERSGERDEQEQPRSDSERWEQSERQQKQTSDGQVDFMA